MAFLGAVGSQVIIWILKNGGMALIKWLSELYEKHETQKANEENTKKHEEDIATNAPPEQKGRSGADLLNGKR